MATPYLNKSNDYWYIREYTKINGKWQQHTLKCLGKCSKEEAERELELWKERVPPMPKGEFDIILADPPLKDENIETQYPTMELEDICRINIPAAKNSFLFLWTKPNKLPEALKVMEAWGFEYRTNFVWVKDRVDNSQSKHEFLLVGRKGKLKVPSAMQRWESVIFASCGEHNEKPRIVYDIIESNYPNKRYLELFAKNERDRWTIWRVV